MSSWTFLLLLLNDSILLSILTLNVAPELDVNRAPFTVFATTEASTESSPIPAHVQVSSSTLAAVPKQLSFTPGTFEAPPTPVSYHAVLTIAVAKYLSLAYACVQLQSTIALFT